MTVKLRSQLPPNRIDFRQDQQARRRIHPSIASWHACISRKGYYNLPLLEHLQRFCLYLQMKPVITKTPPFIGVTGEDPIEKDVKALDHAKMLGKAVAKALKEN